MSKTQSKRLILSLVKRHLDLARKDQLDSIARVAAQAAGAEAWRRANPDDGVGGVSVCPYNPDRAVEQEKKTRAALEDIQAAYDYAVDIFIEEPDEQPNKSNGPWTTL